MPNTQENKQQNLFKDWVNLYTNALYTWALHRTSHIEIAEDLVQDTFLAAFNKLENFKESSSPKTWLFAILNNKIIDYYRKNKVKFTVLDEVLNSDNSIKDNFNEDGNWRENTSQLAWTADGNLLDDEAFNQQFSICIEALPSKMKNVVSYKFLQEKSTELICQELEISPSNYWQIMHRAKLQLKQCIQNYWK